MESPLRTDKFVFSEDPAEIPEDGQRRFRPAKPVPVERSYYTKMAPSSVSAPTTAVEISAGEVREEALCKQPESVVASKERLQEEPSVSMNGNLLTDETLDVQQIGKNPFPCTKETDFPVPGSAGISSPSACVPVKMATTCKDSVSAMPSGDLDGSAAGGGGAEQTGNVGSMEAIPVIAGSLHVPGSGVLENPQQSALLEKTPARDGYPVNTAVNMDTVKTTGIKRVPANHAAEENDLLVGGGCEGVNGSSSAVQTHLQPVQSSTTSAWKNEGSYASVLGSGTRGGRGAFPRPGHSVGKFGAGIVGGFRRRNVVQLKWEGEGTPPVRGRIVELILEMGFRAADIFALICPLGSYEYDLSFMKPEGLDLFWERYEKCKGLSQWGGLVPKVISRQPLIKSVTILVRNESIPEADLAVWLRRYGEVLTPLRKTLDEHGIWTGAWTVSLKLRVLGNVVQHLPSSAFLGRDRLTVFYQGQPKVCNRCGDKGHLAASCTLKKCSLCQGLGHLARECTQIRCNLCQQLGHPYSQCPEALHNLPGLETELRRLDEEDEAADVREDAGVSPPSVSVISVVSESVIVSPSNVVPESVSSVVSPVVKERRSSRLAEAAGGAGLADLPPRLVSSPVPLPRQRKRGQQSVEGLGRDGVDGVEGGVSISHVSPSPEVDSDDQGWERGKGRKKKKKRRESTVNPSFSVSNIGAVTLGNRYNVLSGDEMASDLSFSLSSMDEGEPGGDVV